MKSRRISIGLIALLALVWSGCSKSPFFRGGEEISLKEATPIEQVKTNPRAFAGQKVLVEGTVVGVCKGSGCWALIEAGPSGETIYAKSADHSVGVPTDCEGSWIRVEGEVVLMEPAEGAEAARDHEDEHAGEHEHGHEHEHEHEHAEGETPHACPMPDCYVDLVAVELMEK